MFVADGGLTGWLQFSFRVDTSLCMFRSVLSLHQVPYLAGTREGLVVAVTAGHADVGKMHIRFKSHSYTHSFG